jgi:hypothetical protein
MTLPRWQGSALDVTEIAVSSGKLTFFPTGLFENSGILSQLFLLAYHTL